VNVSLQNLAEHLLVDDITLLRVDNVQHILCCWWWWWWHLLSEPVIELLQEPTISLISDDRRKNWQTHIHLSTSITTCTTKLPVAVPVQVQVQVVARSANSCYWPSYIALRSPSLWQGNAAPQYRWKEV